MATLYKNPRGIEFERTDYKKRSKVKVHNSGYNIRTYRFNNVECFESPYISWANLDCCGGWMTTDEYISTAVQNGQKLFAQIVHEKDTEFVVADDVVINTAPHSRLANYRETHISRKGRISDYYDLDAVFDHYVRLGIGLTSAEESLIREYCDAEIASYATEEAPFDYNNIRTIEQLVANGLLLGYPLESTASIIEEWYKC